MHIALDIMQSVIKKGVVANLDARYRHKSLPYGRDLFVEELKYLKNFQALRQETEAENNSKNTRRGQQDSQEMFQQSDSTNKAAEC